MKMWTGTIVHKNKTQRWDNLMTNE